MITNKIISLVIALILPACIATAEVIDFKTIFPPAQSGLCKFIFAEDCIYKATADSVNCYKTSDDSYSLFTDISGNALAFQNYKSAISINNDLYSVGVHYKYDDSITPFYALADTFVISKFDAIPQTQDSVVVFGKHYGYKLFNHNDTLKLIMKNHNGVSYNFHAFKYLNQKIEFDREITFDVPAEYVDISSFVLKDSMLYYTFSDERGTYYSVESNLNTYKHDTLISPSKYCTRLYNPLSLSSNCKYVCMPDGLYRSKFSDSNWMKVVDCDSIGEFVVSEDDHILYTTKNSTNGYYNGIYLVKSNGEQIKLFLPDSVKEEAVNYRIFASQNRFYLSPYSDGALYEIQYKESSMITETPTLIDFDRITKVEIFNIDGKLINTLYDAKSLFSICQSLRNTYYCVFHYKDGIVLKPYYFN